MKTQPATRAIYCVVPPAALLDCLQQHSSIESVLPVYGNLNRLTTDYRITFARRTPFGWDERATLLSHVKQQFGDQAIIRIMSERVAGERLIWTLHATHCQGMAMLIPGSDYV